MQFVEVIFTRRHALGSLALRAFMWSKWSHCGIVDREAGCVIEATAKHGVRATPLSEVLEHSSKTLLVKIPVQNARAVINAAWSQVGKRYDWWGCAGIAFRRRWQDQSNWFCSELVAWSFEQGGSPLFDPTVQPYRITPRDIAIPYWTRHEWFTVPEALAA